MVRGTHVPEIFPPSSTLRKSVLWVSFTNMQWCGDGFQIIHPMMVIDPTHKFRGTSSLSFQNTQPPTSRTPWQSHNFLLCHSRYTSSRLGPRRSLFSPEPAANVVSRCGFNLYFFRWQINASTFSCAYWPFACLLAFSFFLSLWLHHGAGGILVPRMNPWPLQWKCGVLTTESPGKSQRYFLNPGVNLGITVVVQLLSHVQMFAAPWTAAHQASLSKFGNGLDIRVHCSITVHFLRCNNIFVVM